MKIDFIYLKLSILALTLGFNPIAAEASRYEEEYKIYIKNYKAYNFTPQSYSKQADKGILLSFMNNFGKLESSTGANVRKKKVKIHEELERLEKSHYFPYNIETCATLLYKDVYEKYMKQKSLPEKSSLRIKLDKINNRYNIKEGKSISIEDPEYFSFENLKLDFYFLIPCSKNLNNFELRKLISLSDEQTERDFLARAFFYLNIHFQNTACTAYIISIIDSISLEAKSEFEKKCKSIESKKSKSLSDKKREKGKFSDLFFNFFNFKENNKGAIE